ncbi:MAG: MATE family efflux transporter [Bilophila sp.]
MHINTARLRAIWDLTWPQMVMLFCQFVIGITDVWAGGQIGAGVQASIGLITQCQMMFMALAMAAVSGAVASISQSLGAGHLERARRYVGLVVLGGIGIGVLIAGLAYLWREPLLVLVQTPKDILPTATLFFGAYLWSLPGQYVLTIGAAVFRAAKSVLMPLYVTASVCVINIFGDLTFGLGWWGFPAYGAAGVAWATFASVTVGALILLGMLLREKLFTRQSLPRWRWVRSGSPYLLKVAGPALGTSFLWQTGYLVLFVITASLPFSSVNALAGLTAGMRVEAFLFLPAVAFNMTVSVLVGHALGSGNREEAQRVTLTTLLIACVGMSCIGALLWPWRFELAGLLAADPDVQRETADYLMYNILSVPFTVASVVLAGALNGAGATVYPLLAFSGAVWVVRLPVAYFFGHILWQNASGVYLSMLVSQMVQSSALLWVVLRCDWMRFAMLASKDTHAKKHRL